MADTEKSKTPEELRQFQKEATQGQPVMWKHPNAGMVGEASWVVGVDKDPDPAPCWRSWDAGHPDDCKETWSTVWALPGETREEAEAALARLDFLGAAYHVADCELAAGQQTESGGGVTAARQDG